MINVTAATSLMIKTKTQDTLQEQITHKPPSIYK
jgi:hypothetical protein